MEDFLAQFHLQGISHRNLNDLIDLNSKMKRELLTLIQHQLHKIHNNQRIKQKRRFAKSKHNVEV